MGQQFLLRKKFVIGLWCLIIISTVLLYLSPIFAITEDDLFWGGGGGSKRTDFENGTKLRGQTDLRILVGNIIGVFLGFLGILAVIIILYGGFLWMTSAGNEEQVTKAKKMIIAGVIGLAIILASYAIARFIITSLVNATAS